MKENKKAHGKNHTGFRQPEHKTYGPETQHNIPHIIL
jgi:hypothetical protein